VETRTNNLDQPYSRKYYENHCGPFPYDWSEPHWLKFFDAIAERLVVNLKPQTVLDVGCGVGFLVKAFRSQGIEAYGIDISEYAISQIPEDLQSFCRVSSATQVPPKDFPESYDLITCIEVLEHLPAEDGRQAIANMALRTRHILFSSTTDHTEEPTHVNVQPVSYWLAIFASHGFFPDLNFDAGIVSPQAYLLRNRFPEARDEILSVFARYIEGQIARTFLEQEAMKLSRELDQLRARLQQQQAELTSETDQLRARVQEQQETLSEIQESLGWMILTRCQMWRAKLLPQASKRRKSYDCIKTFLKRRLVAPRAMDFKVQIQQIGLLRLLLVVLCRRNRKTNDDLLQLGGKLITMIRTHGPIAFKRQLRKNIIFHYEFEQALRAYNHWAESYDTLNDEDRAAIRNDIHRLSYRPLFSIIMPTYNTAAEYLRRAIDSVRRQLYAEWELCIADDSSSDPHVRQILEEYREKDSRIKVLYRRENGHISVASNSSLDMASGQFVALLDHDDELAEHALYLVAAKLNDFPQADLIYSDEDKLDSNGKRYDPYFKPDWNPDLFLSQNYISHLGVYRTSLVREIGGFRLGYEGAQDWDLAMRVVERIPSSHIQHIPFILYHWRAIPGSAALGMEQKNYAGEAQRKTLAMHFERIGQEISITPSAGVFWRVHYPISEPPPLVSLVMPTRDGFAVLRRCVESIYRKTTGPKFELIIVDNQSEDPLTLRFLAQLQKEHGAKILRYDSEFNYAAINNFAVRHATGEIIGLINNDLEVITPGWLEEMVSHAARPEIGAVGAMLYYPDDSIQHAGVILGLGGNPGVAGHFYKGQPRGYQGQASRALLCQNLSAVTAACLLVRRQVFEEVDGFDENLAIAFNDVDLCLRIAEKGYRNLWTPYAELYHHESASRGYEDTPEKQERFKKECDYMRWRWGGLLATDPAYNPNLALDRDEFLLAFPPRVRKPWLAEIGVRR
jgi:glycosyltransferase involved in cell wall biosynthesis/SAM-dependent methyltransferase